MGATMKGLLKGLRYISQIFDGDEKEPEMQIGLPTDVKHVAHIGWDGPSTTAPSWMNEFRSAPLSAAASPAANDAADIDAQPKYPSAEFQPTGDNPPRPRSTRRKDSSTGSDSPSRDSTRPTRRRPSGIASIDSPSDGSRRGRRNRSAGAGSTPESLESPPPGLQQDLPAIPKQSRRRRTKESTSGGSSRPPRKVAEDVAGDGDGGAAVPAVNPEEGVF